MTPTPRTGSRFVPGDWPGHLPRVADARPLAGGWVGTTWRVRLADGRPAVVKQTPFPADVEVDGLTALTDAGVPVPRVLGWAGRTLVLELLRPNRGEGADWPRLGRAVARMHLVRHHAYGWHRDNRAGRFVQPNAWSRDWPSFFVANRVQVHLADPVVPRALAARVERACEGRVRTLLPRQPDPVLTHGDLHPGNVVGGRWVVDPEVCAADRELDLAYMQMAGDRFPAEFWDAYAEVLPVPEGYQERRPALELHHRLLQVRHFGAARLGALADTLDRLGA